MTNAGPPLCAQGCRSIEIIIVMWPFISQPAPSSLILFPTQRSQRRRRGEKGTGLIVSFILRTHKHYLFKRFSWLLMTSFVLQQESFDGFCFCTCCHSLPHLGIIPWKMKITLVNMTLFVERLNPLNTSLLPLSGTYSNVSNPAEGKASRVPIDLCHYGIPCQ